MKRTQLAGFALSFKSLLLTLGLALGAAGLPTSALAEWMVDGNTVTFVDQVGFTPDGFTAFSGTVALRMDTVTVSGRVKIRTTIVSILPEPGFTFTVKKAGGLNDPVEIEFNNANGSSKFSFLYKPGQTRIDYGVLRLK